MTSSNSTTISAPLSEYLYHETTEQHKTKQLGDENTFNRISGE